MKPINCHCGHAESRHSYDEENLTWECFGVVGLVKKCGCTEYDEGQL